MKSKTRAVTIGILLIASIVVAPLIVLADCNTFPDNRIDYYEGDAVCAQTGNGCTECYDSGGGSCVTNGEECKPRIQNRS